ncbi:hypothetical protein NU688_30235 [Variovorax sp. ZS18.2.2]|uniref:hypothetical protein n=1 Tax=Variovorax sp. ZS18.2.2 TaxID=2971255 RepID=UPI002151AC64|nr:hypothetical protein [Variovorax sp. ZS18.2.2]MCR6480467.1 hypothetical protein [Variovorax sp. ZS18.2.2]
MTSIAGHAHGQAALSESVENLMFVLRELPKQNRQTDALVPIGEIELTLPDGTKVMDLPAYFRYIGDMHIRFVFDAPNMVRGAKMKDLERLGLSPEKALAVAMANLKRVYGNPISVPWNDLQLVKSKESDYDSSYFVDREFWMAIGKNHPDGVVVAVPKRGGLLYTPLSDAKAVAGLRRGIGYLHSSSEKARVSSALYLFKEGKWSVLQPPR